MSAMSDDDFLKIAQAPELPQTPVHPRVLELADGDGIAFVYVVWESPGAAALHKTLRNIIEASLLAELSRPPAELREAGPRPLHSLRLISFAPLPAEALRAFGLRLGEPNGTDAVFWRDAMAHIRGEAQLAGRPTPEAPVAVYTTPVRALPQSVLAIENDLLGRLGDEVFGARPGAFFAALNAAFEGAGLNALSPKSKSLDSLEDRLAELRPPTEANMGPLRWIPPLAFQAFCDALAVVGSQEYRRTIQWAPGEPGEDGLAPEPLVRMKEGEGWVHLPLGQHLLQWLLMPLGRGEVVPPLSEWALDQFAGR